MGFKNILDKVRTIAVGAGGLFPVIAPFIAITSAILPKKDADIISKVTMQAPGEIQQFLNLASHVEAVTEFAKANGATITGQQKAAMLTSGISDIIGDLELMSHHELVDQDLMKKALDGFAQSTVDLAKSLKPKS